MRQRPGNDLILGQLAGRNATLGFSRTERDKHLYCCGGTGTGKSKFLENLIRQDIKNWNKSKCGMIVLDPHGSRTIMPHLLLCQFLISCRMRFSRNFDLPVPVPPQQYRCLSRSVREKPSVAFRPASWPRMRSLPGRWRITKNEEMLF